MMNKVSPYEYMSNTDSTKDILISKAFNCCAATLTVCKDGLEVDQKASLTWLVQLSEQWVTESKAALSQ